MTIQKGRSTASCSNQVQVLHLSAPVPTQGTNGCFDQTNPPQRNPPYTKGSSQPPFPIVTRPLCGLYSGRMMAKAVVELSMLYTDGGGRDAKQKQPQACLLERLNWLHESAGSVYFCSHLSGPREELDWTKILRCPPPPSHCLSPPSLL